MDRETLALAACILPVMGRLSAAVVVASWAPLFQLLLFRLGYILFVRLCSREPVDVARVGRSGLALDRIFSVVFFLLSVLFPFAIIAPLVWGNAR